MTDHISFQDHPLFLKKKAEEARLVGDFDLAADYGRALFHQESTKDNLHYFFHLLLESGAREEAYDLYQSHSRALDDPEDQAEIFNLLLEFGAFDEAKMRVKEWVSQDENLDLVPWEEEIQRQEEAWRVRLEKDQDEQMNKLFSLSHYSVLDQIQILQDSQKLDDHRRFEALRQVISHPLLTQDIRGLALDQLAQMDRQETVAFLHGADTWDIHLDQLSPMIETETFQALIQGLDSYWKNPSLQALVKSLVVQDFPKIYPFHEKIEDPRAWLGYYVQYYEAGFLPEAGGQAHLFNEIRQAEARE